MKVLFLGRFVPFKNPLVFVEAADRLLQHDFIMAGDGPLLQECEAKGKARVYFHGWTEHETAMELMEDTDVFCQLSSIENLWASALIEAMKHKKAIVCTDVGFTSKYLKNGFHMLLIPPDSPSALVKAIERLEDPVLRERLGNNAYGFVKENMSIQKVAGEIMEAIQGVCS